MALSPGTTEKSKINQSAAPTSSQLEAREGPAPAEWQAVKEEIRLLYEKKPLRDVRTILEQRHGFRATERMYKARLSQWGFSKNYSDRDYQICAVLNHVRQKSGKRNTAFVIHGHKRSLKDLHKYIKGRKMSEDDFLASALKNIGFNDHQQAQNAHVRAYTPEPEGEASGYDQGLRSCDASTARGWSDATPSKAVAHLSPIGAATDSVSGSSGCGSHFLGHPYTPSSQHPSPHDAASPESTIRNPRTHSVSSNQQSLYSSEFSPGRGSAPWLSHAAPFSSLSPHPPIGTVNDDSQARKTDQHTRTGTPCQRLGKDVEHMALQIIDAPSLKSLCGHDDITSWRLMSDTSSTDSEDYEMVCPKCHELTRDHFISLPNLEHPHGARRNILNDNRGESSEGTFSMPASSRGHEHSWRWVARCFSACIYMSRGNDELSRISLADADAEFEKMLAPQQDPKVLLALNQTLSILHMHDQGAISKTIMSSAYKVAERVLGRDDPLTIMVRWMVHIADLDWQNCDITSLTLSNVHTQLIRRHGHTDLRSIACLYCYGYMLNVERQLEQAELVLRKVYELSCANLGRWHLQSISALTNLHRALERQGRIDEAIEVLEIAIADSRETLGQNHPRRLESIRTLGMMYERQGRLDTAETLYWRVLEGRIKMLGRKHHFTQGMKGDLEAFLRRRGKWTVHRRYTVTTPNNQAFDGAAKSGRRDGQHTSAPAENQNPRVGVHSHIKAEVWPDAMVAVVESDEQLRLHDLFEWDPEDKWYDTDSKMHEANSAAAGNSIDSTEDTVRQAEAF
ncbi:hypothetical protein HRR83_001687 [Exophiala dermatitidis]|uniref:Clr5 domain-containing protein n=2 Tax=Exophiala dermatitidis TaxID=5970 RepID=H6C5P7_EXODN|nr:uncharacterized protein HMPREF1120_07043 [Exophiala dermatitidis NIH/UT8656]KAJ4516358.1 hypothetical protein HRR73_004821 [Exophiala dermatitidis]EHY59043.1 hypothetical protein HMPREF1120_07043 [Exophiala dermatitidis NIH/UT8656]KAJ4523164.1 hypothetical protein HRR75_001563 [Exophiala dermatitidis]KAJ4526493.1 hypothetical protein HRR74_001691 [Exophiala dermatitidis]KAJ4532261.1 hypothetical protein HRR76_007259 [Exophiala dermatitidis]